MIEKIEEIKRALEHDCPYCALALALTLPDICSKVAFPDKTAPEDRAKRYRDWFDKYVSNRFLKKSIPGMQKEITYINGYAAYLLRCAFLHNGNYDLLSMNPKIKIKKFIPFYTNDSSLFAGMIYSLDTDDNIEIEVDIKSLCMMICIAAKDYYNSIEDKSLFSDDLIAPMCSGDSFYLQLHQ